MRKFLLVSSGILFIVIAAALVILGISNEDEFLIIMPAIATPFLFIGYWNLYSVKYEKRVYSPNEYFVERSYSSAAVGVFYNREIAAPVFMILFSSAGLAILTAFLALNKTTEEISIGLPILSFLVCLIITMKYQVKLSKRVEKL